jgi:hypothetical protein
MIVVFLYDLFNDRRQLLYVIETCLFVSLLRHYLTIVYKNAMSSSLYVINKFRNPATKTIGFHA